MIRLFLHRVTGRSLALVTFETVLIDFGLMYRIGEAALLVGVSPSALRLWERQGLLRPARSHGRYRLYSDADLDHLRHIRIGPSRLQQVSQSVALHRED